MKLLTPISHLFKDKKQVENIIKFSDKLEARERTCNLHLENTTHYHIDFDLNLGLNNKQIEFLEQHVKPRENITTLTFQASKDCEKVTIEDGMYFPNSEIIPIKQQIETTKQTITHIQSIVGTHRVIGIENNNFYSTGAYNISTSLDYLLAVLEFNNLELLFDVAHALVTCANSSIDYEIYSNKLLATGKCNQFHLCQPTYFYDLNGISAKDSHEIPNYELTESSISLAKKWGVKNLTVEYYKNADILTSYLKYLKSNNKI